MFTWDVGLQDISKSRKLHVSSRMASIYWHLCCDLTFCCHASPNVSSTLSLSHTHTPVGINCCGDGSIEGYADLPLQSQVLAPVYSSQLIKTRDTHSTRLKWPLYLHYELSSTTHIDLLLHTWIDCCSLVLHKTLTQINKWSIFILVDSIHQRV